MRPGVKLEMTVGTLLALSDEQFKALRALIGRGQWEQVGEEFTLRVDGAGDYVGVHLPNLFVGIEKDGYTHS